MTTIREHAVTLKDGSPATIRTARPSDAPGIVALFEAAYDDGEGTVGVPGETTWTVEAQRARIDADRASEEKLLAVAAVRGRVVGVLQFARGNRQRLRHQGEFGVWVLPGWRSRGIGRHLLAGLIAWARSQDIERIGLTVLDGTDRAIALYRSLGFREEGRRARQVKYGPGEYADQIEMALFLESGPAST